jgi:hypothetical protein
MDDMSDPVVQQRARKYRDHDLVIEEIKELDFIRIKDAAIRDFVGTKESGQVKLIVDAFMGYLTSKGFRIVKKEGT